MPRSGRAYWTGFLRLSLVSIAVEIHSAIDSSTGIRFHQIHRPTGQRVSYVKSVKGVGPIENADIVKGHEVERDRYVTLDPSEIEAIKLESKKTLDLAQFVDAAEIDPRYFEKPYYVIPADDHAAEGYLVIREALRRMGKAGLGQITMSGREHLVAVAPVDKGLMMEVLRYADEIKPARAYFHDLPEIKLDKEMVSLATELIRRKASPFEPERFRDSFAVAMKALVDEKAKGGKVTAKPEAALPPSNVVDLMHALRNSLRRGEPDDAKPEPKRRAAGKARR